jgi:NADH-quinone oxidoreductase subunit G
MADQTTEHVKLIIDDVEYDVPKGANLVDAAKRYAGIDIPVFCYHPKLGHDGNCRMCLVELATPRKNAQSGEMELAWFPTLQTACTQYISDGMAIRTVTDKVVDGRREILEFLLSSHPLDCPICQKGGECPLQNLTMRHGPGTSRMYWDDRMRLGKQVPLGEIISLDQERCIQCQRCVRFQDQIADEHVLDFDDRSRGVRIITNSVPGFDSIYSGNTTDICPVGALLTDDYHYDSRPWEMTPVATVCTHCPVGCNMSFDTRTDRAAGGRTTIRRAMPRQNEWVNEIWTCDKGRFAYHHMQDYDNRLTTPLIRKGGKLVEATWGEALDAVAGYVRNAGSDIAAIAGGRLSNEDYYSIQKLVRGRGSNHLFAFPDGFLPGEIASQVSLGSNSDLQQLGTGDVIIVAGTDLHEEGPVWHLRVLAAAKRGATIITVNARGTSMDKYATAHITPNAGDEAIALSKLASSGAGTKMLPKESSKAKKNVEAGTESSNQQATTSALDALKNANNVVIFVGAENLDTTAARNLVQAAANVLIATDHVGRPNNGLIVVWPSANGQGAHDMGFSSAYEPGYAAVQHLGSDYPGILSGVESGSIKVLYVAGADLVFHDAAAEAALRSSKSTIIVTDMYLSATADLADVVLPVQSAAETEGTFTNGERRVQRFYPAVERVGDSQADWWIAQQIGAALGMGAPAVSAAAVMAEIAKTVPGYKGITYQRLAQYVEQFPDVGGDDLYYGGTAFQNRYGVGVQVPAGAEDAATKLAMKSGDLAVMSVVKPDGNGDMILKPINLIYDREPVFEMGAPILHQRIPAPHVGLNPADAQRMSVTAGDPLEVTFDGRTVEAAAHLDIRIPQGVATMPRDLQAQGAPLTTTTARIVKSEKIGA